MHNLHRYKCIGYEAVSALYRPNLTCHVCLWISSSNTAAVYQSDGNFFPYWSRRFTTQESLRRTDKKSWLAPKCFFSFFFNWHFRFKWVLLNMFSTVHLKWKLCLHLLFNQTFDLPCGEFLYIDLLKFKIQSTSIYTSHHVYFIYKMHRPPNPLHSMLPYHLV